MRTYPCTCGSVLFFDNTSCENCGSIVGFCPACRTIAPLHGNDETGWRCGRAECGARLARCYNYRVEQVCNRCVLWPADQPTPRETLCDCCRHNRTIPNLSIPGNREKWALLEAAKRRLFHQLDLLGLPRGTAADGFELPLVFDFKQDMSLGEGTTDSGSPWFEEVVQTGHANGVITINVREADDVERERIRQQFNEPHRTLIGHFRHEIAHYYWQLLVQGKRDAQFNAIFGDPHAEPYEQTIKRHYEQGPPENWDETYCSAYASMHPWEDFAETFTLYLEMVGTLESAAASGLMPEPVPLDDLNQMIVAYGRLGLAVNEINRSMGMGDVLARPIAPPVIEKLRFVHELVQETRMACVGE